MKKAACYARVSTKNQDLERQEEKLKEYCKYKDMEFDLFSEKRSSVKERPKLEHIFNKLDNYDMLVVTKLDRFARSMKDLIIRIEGLKEHSVDFVTTEQPIDTSDKYGELMFNIMGSFAEFERKMIRERMDEGYQEALDNGKVGRNAKISGEVASDFRRWWKQYSGSPSVLKALLSDRHGVDVSNKTIYNTADRLGLRDEED